MANKKKKRNEPESAAETLDAIEGWGDRIADKITQNPVPILVGALSILVVAALVGLAGDYAESGSEASASALAKVQGVYRSSMGATPGSLELPEPANPETARRLRTEAIQGYEAVALEHPGTPAAAIAWLEAGKLQGQLGNREAELQAYQNGLSEAELESGLVAFLRVRQATALEAAGEYAGAAEGYEAAAQVPLNPLKYDMLAEAARCWAQAGDSERARMVYQQIQLEATDFMMPAYTEARLRELQPSTNNDSATSPADAS
ncbi:hypothetical protein MK280_08925 [Myxococcota bacterium]|nr:hypothetical protein [Myxococcota bacterium]